MKVVEFVEQLVDTFGPFLNLRKAILRPYDFWGTFSPTKKWLQTRRNVETALFESEKGPKNPTSYSTNSTRLQWEVSYI